MAANELYYQPSGKFNTVAALYILGLGFAATLLLGAIYGLAIFWIPLIYINVLVVIGYGVLVGLAVGIAARIGKMRNPKLLTVYGLLFGLLAVYIGWISWIYAVTRGELLTFSAAHIAAIASAIAEEGAWSIFGWTPAGAALYGIWLIEAAIIIVGATLAARGVIGATPFCEACDGWIEDPQIIAPLEPMLSGASAISSIEEHDFTPLTSLKKLPAGAEVFTQVELLRCDGCKNEHFLTVKAMRVQRTEDKVQKDEKDLVRNLIISPEVYEQLMQLKHAEKAGARTGSTPADPAFGAAV